MRALTLNVFLIWIQLNFQKQFWKKLKLFPEEIGWLVRGDSILEAWLRVVERIMRYGLIKGTQYGYQQRELIGVTWVISSEDPDNPDLSFWNRLAGRVKKSNRRHKKILKNIFSVFLSPEPPVGISLTLMGIV